MKRYFSASRQIAFALVFGMATGSVYAMGKDTLGVDTAGQHRLGSAADEVPPHPESVDAGKALQSATSQPCRPPISPASYLQPAAEPPAPSPEGP